MKPRTSYIWGKVLIYAGVLALLMSAGILAYNIRNETRAAKSAARVTQIFFERIEDNKSQNPVDPLHSGQTGDDLPLNQTEDDNNNLENTDLFIEIDGERYIGILSIPVLSLELPINISLNESRLNETPCRYVGNISDSLVIAGHNYRKHFSSLSKLELGDLVILMDAAGVNHLYIVEKLETINATDIDAMLDGSYGLTLFTCNYSGMARVAVRCVKYNP